MKLNYNLALLALLLGGSVTLFAPKEKTTKKKNAKTNPDLMLPPRPKNPDTQPPSPAVPESQPTRPAVTPRTPGVPRPVRPTRQPVTPRETPRPYRPHRPPVVNKVPTVNKPITKPIRHTDDRNVSVALQTIPFIAGAIASHINNGQVSYWNDAPAYYYEDTYQHPAYYDSVYLPEQSFTPNYYDNAGWEGHQWGPLFIESRFNGRVNQANLSISGYDSCWYDSQDRLLCFLDDAWYTATE